MPDLTAKRTLVKSPPELWEELSEVEGLSKHFGAFGEIKITKLEPEHTVAWEGEHASGTVSIEPSGWGTKVTLHAELPEEEAPEPAVEEPEPVEPAPAEPEPLAQEPVAEVPAPVTVEWTAEEPVAEESVETGRRRGFSRGPARTSGSWARRSEIADTTSGGSGKRRFIWRCAITMPRRFGRPACGGS